MSVKEKVHLLDRKRLTAALLIVLSLLAAGCGSGGTNEDAGHGSQHETSAGNEHSGHGKGHTEYNNAANIKLEWRYTPERPKQDEQTRIEVFLHDNSGKPIEEYEVGHEKLMHMILVSEDLKDFMHIHPEYKGKGKFEVETAFGLSGDYKLFADFIPKGGSQMTATSRVKVAGSKRPIEPIQQDEELTKTESGVEVSLKLSSWKAGEDVKLDFSFRDASTNKPVNDLEPYLGAIGHVVIISDDVKRYLHVHPTDDNGSGPSAEFATTFPEAGLYKIWGQFQRGGHTFIVPFTVELYSD